MQAYAKETAKAMRAMLRDVAQTLCKGKFKPDPAWCLPFTDPEQLETNVSYEYDDDVRVAKKITEVLTHPSHPLRGKLPKL